MRPWARYRQANGDRRWRSSSRPAENRSRCWSGASRGAVIRPTSMRRCGCWTTAAGRRWRTLPNAWAVPTGIGPTAAMPKRGISMTDSGSAAAIWWRCSMPISSRNTIFWSAASGSSRIHGWVFCRHRNTSSMPIRSCAISAWSSGCSPMKKVSTAGSNPSGTAGGPWCAQAPPSWPDARPLSRWVDSWSRRSPRIS